MSTRDLGSVTSYAMAVALGFEGTEAEWVTAMMEAGDNAASAAASAASASASATSAEASAETARINYGSPLVASTVSAMTELNRVYVYTGSETGYTAGNWYYFDGTTWASGGVYNGEGINTDTTLSVSGMAADAKKVGDVVGDLTELETSVKTDLVSAINEAAQSGGGITTEQWNMIIELFRGALYDTSVLPDPESVIDDLEDSIDKIPATNMSLSTNTLSFTTGTAQTVTVTLSPSNTTDSIIAVSGDSSVATVAVNNRVVTVTPVANGSTTITISTSSGLTATVSVSVALPQLFTITNTLTGCTSDNDATSIYEGESYSATITPNVDYSINSATVMMGSTDITSTAWDSATGEISIASVSGNISVTVTATSPVLYVLPQPYISSGDSENYINTRLMLGETDQTFSIAGYIKFDYAFGTVGTNKFILYLGKATDNSQFKFAVVTSPYSIGGIGSGTPANYSHRQNVKFVITHQAGTLDVYSIVKYFDQEDSTVENRVRDATNTWSSFVSCEKPLYIGKREDGYGVCDNLTLQSLKVFNYVMDSTAITNFISTEEATV